MITLGVKPYGHDTCAAIVIDGKIIAASSEERFNREKHSRRFPYESIKFCLEKAGIKDINEVDEISVGFNYLKLAFYLDFVGFFKYFPYYTKEAITNGKYQIQKVTDTKRIFRNDFGFKKPIKFLDHHDCHAAVVHYTSKFDKSAILTIDGRGELASTRIYTAKGTKFSKVFQINYPNSLGAFYSCITEYLGFKENEDEGKVMGLAPYGNGNLIKKMRKVLFLKNDIYKLDLKYFEFHRFPNKNVSSEFINLFGKPRKKEEKISQRHKDIAKASQVVFEEAVMALVRYTKKVTNEKNLCLTGGVMLNSVVNGKIIKENLFENVYIYPAAGDDGVSIGSAMYSYYSKFNKKVFIKSNQTPYLGYEANEKEILDSIIKSGLNYIKSKNIAKDVAILVSKNKFVGWYQGKAEFGPRALGNRSIIVDPRWAKNKDLVNSKIKFRESFRPFAPSILQEHFNDYFEPEHNISPYMILAFDVKKDKQKVIPAVTHIDGTARVQTVSKTDNQRYWNLINEFYKITGVPVVLNTSFNRMGEPIVNTPIEAINCLLGSGLDAIAMGDYLVTKVQI